MVKKNKHLKNSIGWHYIVIVVVLTIVFSGILIYQNSVINDWKSRYANAATQLNQTQQRLENVSGQFEDLQQDIQRYDSIYGQQRAEAKYAKEIALLELSQTQAEDVCLNPIEMEISGFPELVVEAESEHIDGWPILHVFVDGKHSSTFEFRNEEFSRNKARLQMFGENHTVDLIFSNAKVENSNQTRELNILNITLGGMQINQSQTYTDEGSGPLALNCYGPYQGWDLNSNGAIRFSVKKV